jgi:hypothetical protein
MIYIALAHPAGVPLLSDNNQAIVRQPPSAVRAHLYGVFAKTGATGQDLAQ